MWMLCDRVIFVYQIERHACPSGLRSESGICVLSRIRKLKCLCILTMGPAYHHRWRDLCRISSLHASHGPEVVCNESQIHDSEWYKPKLVVRKMSVLRAI